MYPKKYTFTLPRDQADQISSDSFISLATKGPKQPKLKLLHAHVVAIKPINDHTNHKPLSHWRIVKPTNDEITAWHQWQSIKTKTNSKENN